MHDLMDKDAALAHMKKLADLIAAAPPGVLAQVKQNQQIEAHNAEVDAAKAKKKQLRQIAKAARIPVEALKRMVKSVQPA